jgi:hypothetical protein
MILKYLIVTISFLVLLGCQRDNKKTSIVIKNETFGQDIFVSNNRAVLSPDTLFKILYQEYNFPDSIYKNLPKNSTDFFATIDFPIKYPEKFSINYFCENERFRLEDFYVFKEINNINTCEYIALIDTTNFIELIARKCDEMENWISLYVLNKDYKVIDYKQLLNVGGEFDYSPIDFNDNIIRYITTVDTLKYFNNEYRIFTKEIFEISDKNGNNTKDIGLLNLTLIEVNEIGQISWRDSLIFKSDYYDTFKIRNK